MANLSQQPTGQYLQNLVEWYACDEASGDFVGSHAGLTLTAGGAPGATTGKVGGCRTFGGSDYGSRASAAAFEFGDTDFSAIGWMYATGSFGYRCGFSKYGGSTNEWITHYTNSSGEFEAYVAGTVARATTFGAASLNTWYMVYAAYDAANDLIKIGVNAGTLDTASKSGGTTPGDSALQIGRWGPNEPWVGRLDNIALYHRQLTADEITWLYNSGNGRTYAEAAAV